MIPKIIHQVYFNIKGKELDQIPLFKKSYDICRSFPGYKHILWDEKKALVLIKNDYPHLEEFYKKMRFDIQRIDFIRYCILHKYGGFYIDLDMFLLKDLEPLRSKKFVFHNVRHSKPNWSWIENDFMGTVQGSLFWIDVIKKLRKNYKEKENKEIYNTWKGRFVLQTTGPYFLSRYFKTYYPNYKPMKLVYTPFQKDKLTSEYYLKDHKANSWVENK